MVTKKIAAIYTLRKSKKVLRQMHRLYEQKEKTLDAQAKERLQSYLTSLKTAILQKDSTIAARIAKNLEETSLKLMPKSAWDRARNFIGSILFALVIAIIIRQMWFEFYTIPTGSMRPTLKETDYLVVSKTDFGLNVPLTTSHFYFNPSLVQRGSIVVFTSENMDIADSDTTYFYLFPGKKQMVKRLIGKPGDTIYFYGGEIYGINAQGKDLAKLRDPAWFQSLEHIPYIRFEGKAETPKAPENGIYPTSIFYQMNEAVAKINITSIGTLSGEMIPQKGRAPLKNYSDLWGIKNFAMARLLTADQLPASARDLEPGILYLELSHHPSLQGAQLVRDEMNRIRPELAHSISYIPLQQEHLDRMGEHLITCRFEVKNGYAFRLGWNPKELGSYLPKMDDVPDGTYEIQDGVASKVMWGGVTQELPSDHPLYRRDPERIQLLYNLGIEFVTQYNHSPRLHPSRYAYFRNQELYLLNAPILKKDDPALTLYYQREYQKQSMSTSVNPYIPFDDSGPPITKEGKIDVDFIRKYGLVVPEKMYLVLGDNHAMSADSRQFGFVPQDNLKGGVTFLFWPPGSRFGFLPQPAHLIFTFSNFFAWASALLVLIGTSLYTKRKLQQPFKFK